MSLGTRIKELRVAKAWTIDELAIRSGVSRDTIIRLEARSTRQVHFDVLDKLATAFEVDPGLLLFRYRRKE